jgi:hypothetical protein
MAVSETLGNEKQARLEDGDVDGAADADARRVALSVCIPCYSASAEMLQESIDSAALQLPAEAELVVLPNGPRAIETLGRVTLPAGARVVSSVEVLDIVTNWNRCLDAAVGPLIHLLHEDDAVAPGFYGVVLDLARRFPSAALYATASQSFADPLPSDETLAAEPELLEGFDAARFLLVDDRHACGNIVLTRRALDLHGGFLPAFEYSLDEEAFLRYATSGGIAFHQAPLYRNRAHEGQLRHSSWLRPEFIREFVGGRIEAARPFGSEAVSLAEDSSVERVVSVAVTLAAAGYRAESVQQLKRLEAFIRPHRSRRITVAKVVCRSRSALALMRARRHLIRGRRP